MNCSFAHAINLKEWRLFSAVFIHRIVFQNRVVRINESIIVILSCKNEII